MDLMEEFEFKPLTDGLGFHKKKNSNNENQPLQFESQTLSSSNSIELPSLEESNVQTSFKNDLEFISTESDLKITDKKKELLESKVTSLPYDSNSKSLFSSTLPRETDFKKTHDPVTVPKFNAPKFNPVHSQKKSNDQTIIKSEKNSSPSLSLNKTESVIVFTEKSEEHQIEKSFAHFGSIILDTFVIMGISVLFTLGLVLATGLDVVSIVMQSFSDLGTQIGVGLLLYSVAYLYLILARSFFGQTLGEWSIEQQLGTQEQQQKVSYIFKLFLRIFVITATGFVILPFLSLIFRKDITSNLCGLSLYKRVVN